MSQLKKKTLVSSKVSFPDMNLPVMIEPSTGTSSVERFLNRVRARRGTLFPLGSAVIRPGGVSFAIRGISANGAIEQFTGPIAGLQVGL